MAEKTFIKNGDKTEESYRQKSLCMNCYEFSPNGYPFPFCPWCGASMENGREKCNATY